MAIWVYICRGKREREREREREIGGRRGGRGRRIMGSTGETKIKEENHISDPFLFLL